MTKDEQVFLALVAIGAFSVDEMGRIWRHRRLVGSKVGAPSYWNDLPEALRTGKAQNETKHGQKGVFEELYADLPKLEQFLGAMTGLSRFNFEALAAKFAASTSSAGRSTLRPYTGNDTPRATLFDINGTAFDDLMLDVAVELVMLGKFLPLFCLPVQLRQ